MKIFFISCFIFFFIVILSVFILSYIKNETNIKQLEFIKNYKFPLYILIKFNKKYPNLNEKEINLVSNALMNYFYICNMANGKAVAMPSIIVDELWHEFILFSKEYEKFCKKAFGKFLHHTPVEAKSLNSEDINIKSMQRAWELSCFIENIDPKNPNKLPLLFEIDKKLNIANRINFSIKKKPGIEELNNKNLTFLDGDDTFNNHRYIFLNDLFNNKESTLCSSSDTSIDNSCFSGCSGD